MPIKSRVMTRKTAPATAVYKRQNWTLTSYKASCNKDATIFGATPVVKLRVSDTDLVDSCYGSEWISYGNSLFKSFNNCYHLKRRTRPFREQISLQKEWCVTTTYPFYSCYSPISRTTWGNASLSVVPGADFWVNAGLGSMYSNRDSFFPVGEDILATKIVDLDRLALEEMIPKLDRAVSIPNFIWELRDLKFMVRQVRRLFSRRAIARVLRDLVTRPLRMLSHGWLSAIYGWIPFVNDVKKIVSTLFTVGDQVRDFIEGSGHRITYHFEKAVSPLMFEHPASWFSSTIPIIIDTDGGSPMSFAADCFESIEILAKRTRTVSNFKYHATMDFQYELPMIGAFWRQFLGEMDVWGINRSISEVWDAIPFSFVVDWVLNIGGWLEQFDFKNLPVQVVIHDFCRSFKYDLEETLDLTDIKDVVVSDNVGDGAPGEWTHAPLSGSVSRKTESYYRLTGIPDKPAWDLFPNWRTPGGLQIVNGIALLLR